MYRAGGRRVLGDVERRCCRDRYLSDCVRRPRGRTHLTANEGHFRWPNEPILEAYRNADVRTFGKALAIVKGWRNLGKVRRFAQPPVAWFCREFDGKMWVEAPAPRDEIDDLLG